MTTTAASMSVVYLDANGYQTIRRIRSSGSAASILGEILNASNAAYIEFWESAETINPAPAPVAAPVLPGSLVALLTFKCADFTEAQIIIPAPQARIFYADGKTVDQLTIGLLIAACIANLVSSSGSPAVQYVSGYLIQL